MERQIVIALKAKVANVADAKTQEIISEMLALSNQVSQEVSTNNGLSSVCVFKWLLMYGLAGNPLPQISQLYGLTSLCRPS